VPKAPSFPSFASDPAYTQAVAEANTAFQEQRSNLFNQQGQLLLQLGRPELARAIYRSNWLTSEQKRKGKKPKIQQLTPFERNQLAAIRANANPLTGTSTFAKIGREYQLQQEAMNNELNAANLFYSGYRGKQLGELGRTRQFSESEALYGAQQGLNQYQSQLLAARQQRRQAVLNAATLAYQRLLAQRLGG
jgi:hypothetical protein